MVNINMSHINQSAPEGVMGGAMCICEDCTKKRNELIDKLNQHCDKLEDQVYKWRRIALETEKERVKKICDACAATKADMDRLMHDFEIYKKAAEAARDLSKFLTSTRDAPKHGDIPEKLLMRIVGTSLIPLLISSEDARSE